MDKLLEDLSEILSPTGTDLLYIKRGGVSSKVTYQNLIAGVGDSIVAPLFTASVGYENADYLVDGLNDHVQIQQAINAVHSAGGGVVFIKKGTYDIGASLEISLAKGMYILGESQQSTILKAATNLDDYIFTFTRTDQDIWASFFDFKIDGNCDNQTAGGGIDAPGAIECIFERIWFHKCYDYGLRLVAVDTDPLSYGHHNKIMHCHFDEGAQSDGIGQGIYINQNDENDIHNNDFQYMGGTGRGNTGAIFDTGAGLNSISGNVFVSCYQAIRTQDSSRTLIRGNTFDLCEDWNVVVKGEEILVEGNMFYQPSASPIYIDYYGGNTIANNVLLSHETNGTTHSLIRDNGDPTSGGGNLITGNKFRVKGTLSSGKIIYSDGGAKNNIIIGNIGLDNNVVTLTPVPDIDLTASGTIATMTAAENLVFGDCVYINSSGKMAKADADALATASCVAMCLETISADASGRFLFNGFARKDAWTWTVGGTIYLSTDAGGMTQTAPSGTGDVVQILGVATHADRILFNPNLAQVEIT